MKKILFIINPKAGVSSKLQLPDLIRQIINREHYEVHIAFTSYKGHAAEMARQAVISNFDMVAAAGGDGSVNEVASQLVNTPLTLGVLPIGSGNGLANKLGIPLDIRQALQRINRNYRIKIDVGMMNQQTFFSTAGTGFEALIVHDFARTNVRGMTGYADKILRRIFSYHPEVYTIQYNETESICTKAFMLSFGNSGMFGYGIGLTHREAVMDDGLLEMTLVRDFLRIRAPYLLMMAAEGKARQLKEVRIERVSSAVVSTEKPVLMQIDGEPAPSSSEMHLSVLKQALNVLV